MSPKDRIKAALDIAYSYSQIDGAHHKAWSIDQMVRLLLGDKYEKWVEDYESFDEESQEKEYEWDTGVTP